MALTIEEKINENVVVLELTGSLDAGSIENLYEKIKESKQDKHSANMVLVLSALEFISSAGWSAFIEASKDLRGENGDLRLASMRETASRIFSIMGLEAWIKTYPSAEAAVKSYAE